MIEVTALRKVPAFARGLVRDLRVRWALEEAQLPYRVRLLSREDQKSESYRHEQPFGQVPALNDEGVQLFESGAIVLYVAEKTGKLLPGDPAARARAKAWVFAALNSIEPAVQHLTAIDLFYPNEEWAKLRRPSALQAMQSRLSDLSKWLEDKEYLESEFTVGDLMMTSVLRIPRHLSTLNEYPILADYVKRNEARPAFQKALAAQLQDFEA